jgi:ribosomal subunit interface protein
MRIQVKGRSGVTIDDELRSRVDKKLDKVARQVSALAELELELSEERNPAIRESQVAEATLHLKGVTLRARESSTEEAPRQAAGPSGGSPRGAGTGRVARERPARPGAQRQLPGPDGPRPRCYRSSR